MTQMQMQTIDLVLGDQVNITLYVLHAEEMPRYIEHRAAPLEAGAITDRNGGQANGTGYLRRNELSQCLHCIEQSCETIGFEQD